jgi:site-specific DNA-cytosine methylase
VVEADDHGVPQSRHRVFLFGIRDDVAARIPALSAQPSRFVMRKAENKVGMGLVMEGLPALRSRLSQEDDSHAAWNPWPTAATFPHIPQTGLLTRRANSATLSLAGSQPVGPALQRRSPLLKYVCRW